MVLRSYSFFQGWESVLYVRLSVCSVYSTVVCVPAVVNFIDPSAGDVSSPPLSPPPPPYARASPPTQGGWILVE